MKDDPLALDETRLDLTRNASRAFWRFYKAGSIFVLCVFWLAVPILAFGALQQRDFGGLAFCAAVLVAATLACRLFVWIADQALQKIAMKGVRRMV